MVIAVAMKKRSLNATTLPESYDGTGCNGHGNMIATLARSSSTPYYVLGNERQYDVWGGVRSGATSGDPNTRYCENLGHKQDDESGLIYMRARYYEPSTGRFVSEDPAIHGRNWYVYCGNEPIGKVDRNGKWAIPAALATVLLSFILLGALWEGGNEYFAQEEAGGLYSWERIAAKAGKGALAVLLTEIFLAIFIVPVAVGSITGPIGVGIVAAIATIYVILLVYIMREIDHEIDRRWPER